MDPRNDTQLQQDLLTHLPLATRQALYTAADAAYQDAGRQFDPDIGADMQLFGFTLFKYIGHQIRTAAEADPSLGISILGSSTGAFRFKAGPFVVAPYSCGHQAPRDPWTEFPGNDKGAGLLSEINTGQLEIFREFDVAPVAIVLGHYGNPDGGLEALFLKMPMAHTHGRISRWGYVEPLYQIGGTRVAPAREATRSPVLPGPAQVTRLTVLPFKKKPAQDSETEGA